MDSRIEWAELLIEARRYHEAESILRDMSDPHAYQLMRKSLALRSGRLKKKAGAWDRRKVILAAAVVVALVVIVIFLYESSRPAIFYSYVLF